MIDWISFHVPHFDRKMNTGRFVKFDKDGAEEFNRPSFDVMENSSSRKISVRYDYGQLYVSGNVAKYYQNHNVYGSMDFSDLMDRLRVDLGKYFQSVISFEHMKITRLDITYSAIINNQTDLDEYMYSLSRSSSTQHGRAVAKAQSVYFGIGSRRWTFKIYNKNQEIKKHDNQLYRQIDFKGKTILRFELQLRSLELKKLWFDASNYDDTEKQQRIFNLYMKKLNLNFNDAFADTSSLTRAEYAIFQQWKNGLSVQLSNSQSTSYRHRRAIRKKLNIDIFRPPLETNIIVQRPREIIQPQILSDAQMHEIFKEQLKSGDT